MVRLSSKVPFCIRSSNDSSRCSTVSLAFGIVSVLDFDHSKRCIVVSHYFNLQFPNDKWCWASFYMLTLPSMFSLIESLFRSLTQFLMQLLIFLLLSFQSSLYILENSPLSDMFWKYFLLPWRLFSHSLDIIFCKEVFTFNEVHLIIFVFHGSCLQCCI